MNRQQEFIDDAVAMSEQMSQRHWNELVDMLEEIAKVKLGTLSERERGVAVAITAVKLHCSFAGAGARAVAEQLQREDFKYDEIMEHFVEQFTRELS